MIPTDVPKTRLRELNQGSIHPEGEFVLYWMIANRRSCWNFSLDRALDYARALDKPLLVLEALRLDYPWASQRLHQFVLDGMRANQAAFANSPVTYFPYLERQKGEGSGLLEWLAERAAVVITDDFPCFFLPRMLTAAATRIQPKLEAVDSNGLFPMRATDRTFA
ncbi:MAG: deoxyribodipyrimidine photolyase, partial [Candidatus Eremiobacteraeota bacterium]|nr:deoxyribodipyrimidine photolyase [Candidatus Eremiobacteraeota bacterium]